MHTIANTALRSAAHRVQQVRRLASVLPSGGALDPSSGRPATAGDLDSRAILVHNLSFHTTCPTLIGGGGIRTRRRRGSAAALKEKEERQRQEEEADETTPSSTVSEEAFTVAAVELLDKVHAAMIPLQPLNQGMNLMRGKTADGHELHVPSRNMRAIQNINVVPEDNNEVDEAETEKDKDDEEDDMTTLHGEYLLIDLGPVHGQYTLQSDVANRVLRLQSPLSGAIPYRWDAHALDWCSLLDNHNLVGLLVRDLIRQIQGVPNL